jgi:hypothetical protein
MLTDLPPRRDTMDRFEVHIRHPDTDELPGEVRRGFRLLAKVIAGQIRQDERDVENSVLVDLGFARVLGEQ